MQSNLERITCTMNLEISLKSALLLALAIIVIIGVAAFAHGQSTAANPAANSPTDPPKASSKDASKEPYTPTAEQAKDLEIAQLKEQLAQSQWAQRAQAIPEFAPYQQSAMAMQKQCASVIAANKWPATVQCDIQQVPVRFVDTANAGSGSGAGTGTGGASASTPATTTAPATKK
jgi:hypothetical protein